jgi:hypothetical protein
MSTQGLNIDPNAMNDPRMRGGLLRALLGTGGAGEDQPWSEQMPATQNPDAVTPGKNNLSTPDITPNRIDDDHARSLGDDFVNQAPEMASASRMNLADAIRAQQTAQPDRLQQMQSEYDQLGQRPQHSLKQKIGLALMGIGGGRGAVQQALGSEQNPRNSQREKLLQEMEAEKRLQEQEQIEGERQVGQQKSEDARLYAQQDREDARLKDQMNMAQPEHMDTDQGPIQYNRETRQWEPISVNGQRVGAKAQPKPDSSEQQFFDSPEEQGKTLGQKVSDYAARTQKPERAPRDKTDDIATKEKVLTYWQPTLDSAERANVMSKNYVDATQNHNQQAMLSLLANHLGMTMGLQKGARMTKDIIREAQQSQPWLQGVAAKFDKDGYLSGVTLSPPQMKQMLDLGFERYREDVKKSRSQAGYIGVSDEPARQLGRESASYYLQAAGGDANKARAMAKQDGWTF